VTAEQPEDNDPDIVPIDYVPPVHKPTEVDDEPGPTDLDLMLATLEQFNVKHTLVVDEDGSTVEIEGGDRGTFGFSGLTITVSFAPPARNEVFLFIGVTRP